MLYKPSPITYVYGGGREVVSSTKPYLCGEKLYLYICFINLIKSIIGNRETIARAWLVTCSKFNQFVFNIEINKQNV